MSNKNSNISATCNRFLDSKSYSKLKTKSGDSKVQMKTEDSRKQVPLGVAAK